jgi:hypothetical protein
VAIILAVTFNDTLFADSIGLEAHCFVAAWTAKVVTRRAPPLVNVLRAFAAATFVAVTSNLITASFVLVLFACTRARLVASCSPEVSVALFEARSSWQILITVIIEVIWKLVFTEIEVVQAFSTWLVVLVVGFVFLVRSSSALAR